MNIYRQLNKWVSHKERVYLFLGVLCLLGSVTLTAQAILTVSNSGLSGDSNVTVDAAGALNIGTASSTAVNIGKAGTPVIIPGGFLALGVASTTGGQLIFQNASSSFTTILQASSSQAANLIFTLPATKGSAGQAMLTDGNGGLYFGSSSGASQWLSGTSSSISFSGGNVGINTTTPLALLSVVGSASSTAPLFDVVNSTGTSLFLITPDGSVTVGTAFPAGSGTSISPTLGIASISQWVDPITSYNAAGTIATTTGTITSGTSTLVVANATGWRVGEGIAVAGAGTGGSGGTELVSSVTAINGLVFTLANNATASVSGATVNHDDTVALGEALMSGYPVHLRAGNYNVSGPIATCSTSCSMYGDLGFSFIWSRSKTANLFTINYGNYAGTPRADNINSLFANFKINQAPGITPTAGYAFVVGSGSNSITDFTSGVYITNVSMANLWCGIETTTGLIASWFTNIQMLDFSGGNCGIYMQTPSPGGDLHWNDDELSGYNTGVTFGNSFDTQEVTNLKTNDSGVVIGAGIRLRMVNPSIEGDFNSTPLYGIQFLNDNASQIQIVGGAIDGMPNCLAATNVTGLEIVGVNMNQCTTAIQLSGGSATISGSTLGAYAGQINLTNGATASISGNNVTGDGAFVTTYSAPYFLSTDATVNSVTLGANNNPFNIPSTINAATQVNSQIAAASVPVLSPIPGVYSTSQNVTIACTNGTPYYSTTNGSVTPYTTGISVSSTTPIQAMCAGTGFYSQSTGGTYSILPSPMFTDTFSGSSLSSNWTTLAGAFYVNSNEAGPYSVASPYTSLAYRNDQTFTDSNQYAYATFTKVGVSTGTYNNEAGVAVRVQSSGFQGYGCACTSTECGMYNLYSASGKTQLRPLLPYGASVGDVLEISAVGSTISCSKNGQTFATATDSTYTGGRPGLWGNGISANMLGSFAASGF